MALSPKDLIRLGKVNRFVRLALQAADDLLDNAGDELYYGEHAKIALENALRSLETLKERQK